MPAADRDIGPASSSSETKRIAEGMPMQAALPPLSLPKKIAYGSGVFGISMAQMSVTVLILYFYTDVVGFSPKTAGLILALGAFMDGFAAMGASWVSTKKWSRLGSYRPFLIYVPLPFMASFAAMFTKPDLSASGLFVYAIVTQLAYHLCYAFTLMPHSSLITRLSADADERASIGSIKAILNNLGLLVAGYVGLGTIEQLGHSDIARGFMVFGIVFGGLAALSVLISGIFTRERIQRNSLLQDTASLPAALSLIGRNGQLLVALTATLIFFVGYVMLNGGLIYYFKYIVDAPGQAKLAIVCIGIGGILSPPLWHQVIRRTSKSIAWAAGSCIMLLAFAVLLVFAPRTTLAVCLVYLAMGIGKTAMIVNYYALIADAVDYGHWKHGRRTEAYGFGMLSLVTKVGSALGGALLGLMLSWAGYVANHAQSAETVGRMLLATCGAPAAVIAASGLTILLFRIDARRHRALMAELS